MKNPAMVVLILLGLLPYSAGGVEIPGPYDRQVAEHLKKLKADSAQVRAGAAEALGFLRAYSAEEALIAHLQDRSPLVRREAAMALAWCGGRGAVRPLIQALDDADWVTRQAAHVSLTNLTGMELPYDGLADSKKRAEGATAWREWWETVPEDRPPREVLQLLSGPNSFPAGRSVKVSTTYKGPPEVLVDRQAGPEFWQTKNVPFPQWCIIDLGRPEETFRVTVHQYGPRFVMTDWELAVSLDGETFEIIERRRETTPVKLVIDFPERRIRYVRITSYASRNRTYPTTFFEVQVNSELLAESDEVARSLSRQERAIRALGSLGGEGATEAVLKVLGPSPPAASAYRPMVRNGIRSLGRLRDEAGFNALISLLENPMWARNAAGALGDFGHRRAVPALLAAYSRYAKGLDGADPKDVPRDDKMGFPSEDRMLETPFWIAYTLCRLPLDHPDDHAALRRIAPLIMANLPGDHDTFFLYEPEVGHLLTRHLMETTGLRQEACEYAFEQLGQPRRTAKPLEPREWPVFPPPRLSSWLPAICTEREDLLRLVELLRHEDGWVRMNAAKTLAWLGDVRAMDALGRALESAKAEVEYGYSGVFKDEEYNDPAPRWREAPIRALGLLGAGEYTDLISRILEDEGSVLEIRHAAAQALADLGNEGALAALERAARGHPFHSIRMVARDALRSHGIRLPDTELEFTPAPGASPREEEPVSPENLEAVVFIKGSNNIPNTIGTVEQADRWRQTYAVTDSGPAYRPGRNLYILRPPQPDGLVNPLTQFEDGYVAEPELSWDGSQVIFTRRGQENPWWHIYRIRTDGSRLEQLTSGPYHDVGPAFLPDGRIVFASSRVGIRDEYHGYPCTSLHVMNTDGSGIHLIATNIGRDNEPALLSDGRVAFSRLEVFYSRNKTELTLHAAYPDGTQDMVLYGPERRLFWRNLDHGPPTPADGQENPLTHRVLRMTQPQPMPDGEHIVVVTQGGLTLVGPRRDREAIITPDNKTRSYTTPFPLPDGRLLCASTLKTPDREKVDLGLYLFDPAAQKLELIYNDPDTADFEPRPVLRRKRPMVVRSSAPRSGYSGWFLCRSVFITQEREVAERGRLVRLIEGMPVVARHSTQTNPHEVWKNHGGTFARVLGTAPLAADGSFYVEAPADRLLHFQVLDSDRRVVGNQKTWIYPRPGEVKSCVGCHQDPHLAPPGTAPLAARRPPLDFLHKGDEFKYRAKAWFKGSLPPEIDERTRTARSVNLLGR